ncbi:MAG: ankyrin repeat domain-containing protein [Epsilonproteobacteria bacterium]|nr:ankyrin repeat domain-containing protein [Campylobacterota bacterium]
MKKIMFSLAVVVFIPSVTFAAEELLTLVTLAFDQQSSLSQYWEQEILRPLKVLDDKLFNERGKVCDGQDSNFSVKQNLKQVLQVRIEELVISNEVPVELKINYLRRVAKYLYHWEPDEVLICLRKGICKLVESCSDDGLRAKVLVNILKDLPRFPGLFFRQACSLLVQDNVGIREKGFLWFFYRFCLMCSDIDFFEGEGLDNRPEDLFPSSDKVVPASGEDLPVFARGVLEAEELMIHYERRHEIWNGLKGVDRLREKVDELHHLDNLLCHAIKSGNTQVAGQYVQVGGNPNAKRGSGEFAPLSLLLCYPKEREDLNLAEVVKELIAQGADVNVTIYSRETLLHLAASNGLVDIAELLLTAGADIYARDDSSRTPLDRAREKGHNDCVKFLEEYVVQKKGE